MAPTADRSSPDAAARESDMDPANRDAGQTRVALVPSASRRRSLHRCHHSDRACWLSWIRGDWAGHSVPSNRPERRVHDDQQLEACELTANHHSSLHPPRHRSVYHSLSAAAVVVVCVSIQSLASSPVAHMSAMLHAYTIVSQSVPYIPSMCVHGWFGRYRNF